VLLLIWAVEVVELEPLAHKVLADVVATVLTHIVI
jgi:hypothetical protein